MIQENAKFFEKMTACFGDLKHFEQQIAQIAELARMDLRQFEIDHLAVRMNSLDTAQQWRALLQTGSETLKESEVNGRPIGLFALHQAVTFFGQKVSVIELPFPKGKTYPIEGWEHIEIVFPMHNNESVEQWIERTLSHFQLRGNSELVLKISQPEVAGEQLANPTIAITVKNETLGNPYCLKVHPYDIKSVIRSETVL